MSQLTSKIKPLIQFAGNDRIIVNAVEKRVDQFPNHVDPFFTNWITNTHHVSSCFSFVCQLSLNLTPLSFLVTIGSVLVSIKSD